MSNNENLKRTQYADVIKESLQMASEYERLIALLNDIPDFVEFHRRKLEDRAIQESFDPFAPRKWSENDCYISAIMEIVNKWAKGEQTEYAKEIAEITNKNLELRKRNNYLEAEMNKVSTTLLLAFNKIYNNKCAFSDIFSRDFEDWILRCASSIDYKRREEAKANKSSV